jgi:hypothetical protein
MTKEKDEIVFLTSAFLLLFLVLRVVGQQKYSRLERTTIFVLECTVCMVEYDCVQLYSLCRLGDKQYMV